MTETMTKKERVLAAVSGRPVDRPPYSFWRHFYDRETTAEGLAESMVEFAKQYDLDFLKVNPRAQYHAEVWGTKFRYSGDPMIKPEFVASPIQAPSDWKRIQAVAPDTGPLGEQLEALRQVKSGIDADTMFVETIFNPLSVAAYMVGGPDELLRQLRSHPQELESALDAIATTFHGFARACLEVGCSGIFFATTTLATYNRMSDEEWNRFGRKYDLRVLEAVANAPFNILHVCQDRNMLMALLDYPAHALSWAATSPTNPSLADLAKVIRNRQIDRALIGGISGEALTAPTPDLAIEETREARAKGGPHWVAGPNCSIPVDSKDENLRAVVRELTHSEQRVS